jgi:hypothetical protein
VCCHVCLVEDYLRDGLNKANAIIHSLDLGEAVREVIPVIFPLAEEGCLFFLVKLVEKKIQNFDFACQIFYILVHSLYNYLLHDTILTPEAHMQNFC